MHIWHQKKKNIVCINYSDLLYNHSSCIGNLCKDLSLELIEKIKIPKNNNYIKGIEYLKVSEHIRNEMNEYCRSEIQKY